MSDLVVVMIGIAVIGFLFTMFLATGIYLVYSKLEQVEKSQKEQRKELYIFNPTLLPPVKPIKTCMSKNPLGVNGVLIVGECPICGKKLLNNRDNQYCGGCARRLEWKKDA